MLSRWLKQTQQAEEAPIINLVRSAAPRPQERSESQAAPQTAMVDCDQGSDEVEQQEEEGGYKLTFSTSSMWFAGTNAQVHTEHMAVTICFTNHTLGCIQHNTVAVCLPLVHPQLMCHS